MEALESATLEDVTGVFDDLRRVSGIAWVRVSGAEDSHSAEVAKWHVDGMNYVFTMTLTDHHEHDGGDYIYYLGHRADVELRTVKNWADLQRVVVVSKRYRRRNQIPTISRRHLLHGRQI